MAGKEAEDRRGGATVRQGRAHPSPIQSRQSSEGGGGGLHGEQGRRGQAGAN